MEYMEDEDNGYVKTIRAGKWEYSIQLAPPAYMACRQFYKELEQGIDTAYQKRLADINGYMFFLIQLKQMANAPASINERIAQNAMAEEEVMYYQQRASQDISLHEGGTIYNPATYVYEDNYGLSPYNTIVVGFANPCTTGDVQLVFNDRYTQSPLLKIGFSQSELLSLSRKKVKTN